VFCTSCGHPNKDDARFCASCGAALGEDTTSTLAPVEGDEEATHDLSHLKEGLAPGQALLAVTRGPNAGTTFVIDEDREVTTLGRDPRSDLFLDDVTVSRTHAEVRRRSDGFYVHDLGSLNGTYLNRERIEETKLAGGDELQIGRFRLVFVRGDAG
jgi:hypothetical protein